MKHIMRALCLAACALAALTGCGQTAERPAQEQAQALVTGQRCAGAAAAVTPEYAALCEAVTAPLTAAEDGSVSSFRAPGQPDGTRYLDCVSTVENTGDTALDLKTGLYFYCEDGEERYDSCLVLTETADGARLEEAGSLPPGQTARVHYALPVPADVSAAQLTVSLVLPDSGARYTAPLTGCAPPLAGTLVPGDSLTTGSGAVLTVQSCSAGTEAAARTEAGGGMSLLPATDGNRLLDLVVAVEPDGAQQAGTLYGGLVWADGTGTRGVLALEADGAMQYGGALTPGETATTHLLFELADGTDAAACLYVDGAFYAVADE